MNDQPSQVIASAVACIRCGYDLRGIDAGGACPECGGAAVESLVAARSVTKRQVAELVCRILALWLAVRSTMQVILTAMNVAVIVLGGPGSSGEWWWLLFSIAYFVVQVVVCLGLWWGAAWIARQMVAHDGPAIPSQQWSAGDLMTVAVCVLGLYLVATGLQSAAGSLAGGQVARWFAMEPLDASVVGGAVRTIAGLSLVAGRRRVSEWFSRQSLR